MKKYRVEGWIQSTVSIDKDIDANSKEDAIRQAMRRFEVLYEVCTAYCDINTSELIATEITKELK